MKHPHTLIEVLEDKLMSLEREMERVKHTIHGLKKEYNLLNTTSVASPHSYSETEVESYDDKTKER